MQEARHVARRVGQTSTLDGLHDHDGAVVRSGNLIVGTRGDGGVLPVGIVDLQLDELGFRVTGEQLVEQLGTAVEREANMAHQAITLELAHVVPEAKPIVLLVVAPHERMQHELLDPTALVVQYCPHDQAVLDRILTFVESEHVS